MSKITLLGEGDVRMSFSLDQAERIIRQQLANPDMEPDYRLTPDSSYEIANGSLRRRSPSTPDKSDKPTGNIGSAEVATPDAVSRPDGQG